MNISTWEPGEPMPLRAENNDFDRPISWCSRRQLQVIVHYYYTRTLSTSKSYNKTRNLYMGVWAMIRGITNVHCRILLHFNLKLLFLLAKDIAVIVCPELLILHSPSSLFLSPSREFLYLLWLSQFSCTLAICFTHLINAKEAGNVVRSEQASIFVMHTGSIPVS